MTQPIHTEKPNSSSIIEISDSDINEPSLGDPFKTENRKHDYKALAIYYHAKASLGTKPNPPRFNNVKVLPPVLNLDADLPVCSYET